MTAHAAPATMTAPKPDVFPAIGEQDRWGNVILSSRGWYGQYRIKSWATGKEAFVCGQRMNTDHLVYWEFSWEQGYICRRCFPKSKPKSKETKQR